jgi:hypothetical protein
MKNGLGISVLGVDPGLGGAFVITDADQKLQIWPMPVMIHGKDKSVHFDGVVRLLEEVRSAHGKPAVYLERAVSFGMGAKGAFNYGRGFETVVIALHLAKLSVTFVEPGKWTKEMHEGTNADLRPKMRSAIAVERLYPQLVGKLPRKGKILMDGPMDALLIAGYGIRRLGGTQGMPVQPEAPLEPKLAEIPVSVQLRDYLEDEEVNALTQCIEKKDLEGLAFLTRKIAKRLRHRAFNHDSKGPVDNETSANLCNLANDLIQMATEAESEIIGDFF